MLEINKFQQQEGVIETKDFSNHISHYGLFSTLFKAFVHHQVSPQVEHQLKEEWAFEFITDEILFIESSSFWVIDSSSFIDSLIFFCFFFFYTNASSMLISCIKGIFLWYFKCQDFAYQQSKGPIGKIPKSIQSVETHVGDTQEEISPQWIVWLDSLRRKM